MQQILLLLYYKFINKSAGKRTLKISQYLAKLETKIEWNLFSRYGVYIHRQCIPSITSNQGGHQEHISLISSVLFFNDVAFIILQNSNTTVHIILALFSLQLAIFICVYAAWKYIFKFNS